MGQLRVTFRSSIAVARKDNCTLCHFSPFEHKMLFLVKLKPEYLTIRKSQNNLEFSLVFVTCEEKDFHRVVSTEPIKF